MKKIKIAVSGLGAMGRLHAENILTKIPQAELIALCGKDTRMKPIKEKWDIPYTYTSFKEMMENPEIEAVVIASATIFHKDEAIMALEAGKHVFIEKPIGMTNEECVLIQEKAEASGKKFMVGFMRRYDPSNIAAKEMIDHGDIGQPILYRGYSLDPVWVAEFLAKRAEVNGHWFLDMGVHEYDLSRWFIGSEPETVYAVGGAYSYPVFDKTHDVDNGYALIKFKNKACAFIYVGKTAAHGTHVETEIVGTKGTIRICDDAKNSHIKLYTSDGVKSFCYKDYLERWDRAFENEIRTFIDSLKEENNTTPTAKDGRYATMIGMTVQKAYETGELLNFESLS